MFYIPKTIKISIRCFSAKYAAFRNKNKDGVITINTQH
jgi:hypothetical protein